MRVPLKAPAIVGFVTASALFGMVLGGAFGLIAAEVAPDFFTHFVSWTVFENAAGVAVILGSFGGVMCGGLLGGFAVAAQLIGMWLSRTPASGMARESDAIVKE